LRPGPAFQASASRRVSRNFVPRRRRLPITENDAPEGAGSNPPSLDVQGDGQSIGVPAAGEHKNGSYNPVGGPGIHHWQSAAITKQGPDERGSVFFATIEMTQMPIILMDPNLQDNPVVFISGG
jgi:hypothetical protein